MGFSPSHWDRNTSIIMLELSYKSYSFAADCTCEPTTFRAILNRKDGKDAIFDSDGPVIQVVQTNVGLSEVGVPSNIHCFIIISPTKPNYYKVLLPQLCLFIDQANCRCIHHKPQLNWRYIRYLLTYSTSKPYLRSIW